MNRPGHTLTKSRHKTGLSPGSNRTEPELNRVKLGHNHVWIEKGHCVYVKSQKQQNVIEYKVLMQFEL